MSLKKKLKRLKPPPVPGQVKLLSLLAIVLVCGAPALVSVIDDSYTYEGSSEIQLLDVPSDKSSYVRAPTAEDPINSADVSYIPASENDGTFLMALNDPSEANNVTYARFYGIDMAPLTSGMGTIKVVTSCDPTDVQIVLFSDDVSSSPIYLTQSEVDPSVWTTSLDSIDLIKLRSGTYENMFVVMGGQNELFDMEIFAVGDYVIPYGEIIIGATGAILCFCALMATPWFGTGKIGKRRSKS